MAKMRVIERAMFSEISANVELMRDTPCTVAGWGQYDVGDIIDSDSICIEDNMDGLALCMDIYDLAQSEITFFEKVD